MDSQKVRSSLSGILYAFEIPSPPSTVENTPPSIDIVTTGEATCSEQTGGGVSPTQDCADNNDSSPVEEQACEMRRTELVRSPSRSSSERSYSNTLKLPCLSRQTSDDDEDDIEVGSDVSGKSSMGLLRQLSPRFMRKLTSKKSMNVWNLPETTSETRECSAASCEQSSTSVKSTPGHSRNTSISSTSESVVHSGTKQVTNKPSGYLFGVHRKLVRRSRCMVCYYQ